MALNGHPRLKRIKSGMFFSVFKIMFYLRLSLCLWIMLFRFLWIAGVFNIIYWIHLVILHFNILFTLAFCFLMIWALDTLKKNILKVLVVVLSIIICTFCYWMFYAPLFILAFYWAGNNKKRLIAAYVFGILLLGATSVSSYVVQGE